MAGIFLFLMIFLACSRTTVQQHTLQDTVYNINPNYWEEVVGKKMSFQTSSKESLELTALIWEHVSNEKEPLAVWGFEGDYTTKLCGGLE